MAELVHKFQLSAQQVADLRKVLDPKQFKQAVYQAVARTTRQAKSIAARAVKDKLNIPRKYIDNAKHRRSAIRMRISRDNVPVGEITIRKVALPLIAFKPRWSRRRGVTVRMRKDLPPLVLRHGFLATVASEDQLEQGVNHKGVFLRGRHLPTKGPNASRKLNLTPRGIAGRLVIQERFGPTVLDLITLPEIQAQVLAKIGNALQQNLDSQVKRFLGDAGIETLEQALAGLEGENAAD